MEGTPATKAPIKTDSQGRTLYPDSTPNMHSGPGYQDGMKISGGNTNTDAAQTSGGSLKGDTPLLRKGQSQGLEYGGNLGGNATGTINY